MRIGRLRLGRTRSYLTQRAGAAPVVRTARLSRWCTDGFAGRLYAVFARRSEAAKARLIATTAPGYRIAGVGVGQRLRRFRRRFPRSREIAFGVYRAGPRSTLFFGVGPGTQRVSVVGVAARALLARPRLLHRYLSRARLPVRR